MATVYLACRLGPGDDTPRVVAIKKLFEAYAKQPAFVTMFLDEAHLAARVQHPNVITTHEFLRIPDSLAIVMEFILGLSLEDLLRIARDREIIPPVGVAATILRGALLGLHAAHEAKDDGGNLVGLVHRDISPHNLLIGSDGVARIIDFGIAKAKGRLQVTEAGVMKGKFAYMAPEQIRGAEVDRRADVYAAGVVLWEALTGSLLFQGPDEAEVWHLRGSGTVTIPVPRMLNPKVPTALGNLVLKALETDPAKRFANAQEMADAIAFTAPLATPEEVADWMRSLAGSRLTELEAKRNEVETSWAAGELNEPQPELRSRLPSSHDVPPSRIDGAATRAATVSPSPSPSGPPAAPLPELELELPPPQPSRPALPRPPPPPPRPPSSSKQLVPPPSAPSLEDGDAMDMGESGLKLDIGDAGGNLSSFRSVPSASLDRPMRPSASAVPRRRQEEASGGGLGRWLLGLLLLLVVALLVAVQVGPPYARNAAIAAASARGLVLSVGSVEPRINGLTLNEVTITLPDVPNLSMKAPVVEVDLGVAGNARKISVPGYEISASGSVSDLAAAFGAWRNGPHRPTTVVAKSGHLVWSDFLGLGAQLEGINVSLEAGTKDDAALTMDLPSLSLGLPRGTVGAWSGHLDSSPDETRLVVSLDPTKQDGPPNITVLSRPTAGVVLTVVTPRTKLSHVGVPAELRRGEDPEVDLSLSADISPNSDKLTAHAALTIFGVAAGAKTPVDLVLEGNVSGDPRKLLHVEGGTFTLSKSTTKLTGTVTLAKDGIVVELDRPVARAQAPLPPLVLDTREWTGKGEIAAPTPSPTPSPAPSSKKR